jgi:hypothetical protein
MKLPITIRFTPKPEATTILVLDLVAGGLFYTPMIAVSGQHIPSDHRESGSGYRWTVQGGCI